MTEKDQGVPIIKLPGEPRDPYYIPFEQTIIDVIGRRRSKVGSNLLSSHNAQRRRVISRNRRILRSR